MKDCSFVDRDMFMRFRGGGIGHKAMWDALKKISKEQYELPDELEGDHMPEYGIVSDDENSDKEVDDSDDDTVEDEDEASDGEGPDDDRAGLDTSALGPEDGEENWEDILDEEGYAPL